MENIELYLFVGVILYYLGIEAIFFFKEDWNRYKLDYILYSTGIIGAIMGIVNFVWEIPISSPIIALVIWFVVDLFAEFLSHNIRLKIKTPMPKKKIIVIIILIGILLVLFLISGIEGMQSGAFVADESNWFSDMMGTFINSEKTQVILVLILIGSINIIIAKGRRSRTMAIGGFFLLVALPIFDLLDTFFDDELFDIVQTTVFYETFQSVGLAAIVYILIKFAVYMLLLSVVVSLLKVLDEI